MAKVFFSYSREDKETVNKVKDYFEKNGNDVWLDEDISAVVPFPQSIEVAIKSCDFMAIFLSKSSKDSPEILSNVVDDIFSQRIRPSQN